MWYLARGVSGDAKPQPREVEKGERNALVRGYCREAIYRPCLALQLRLSGAYRVLLMTRHGGGLDHLPEERRRQEQCLCDPRICLTNVADELYTPRNVA